MHACDVLMASASESRHVRARARARHTGGMLSEVVNLSSKQLNSNKNTIYNLINCMRAQQLKNSQESQEKEKEGPNVLGPAAGGDSPRAIALRLA